LSTSGTKTILVKRLEDDHEQLIRNFDQLSNYYARDEPGRPENRVGRLLKTVDEIIRIHYEHGDSFEKIVVNNPTILNTVDSKDKHIISRAISSADGYLKKLAFDDSILILDFIRNSIKYVDQLIESNKSIKTIPDINYDEEINTEFFEHYNTILEYMTNKYYRNRNHAVYGLESSLLNALLVATRARPACIIDTIRSEPEALQELLKLLSKYYNLSFIPLSKVDYLVFLSEYEHLVKKEYYNNIAGVLGYCYTKSDFGNRYIDRKIVVFLAKSVYSEKTIELYSTVVPSHVYNDESIQDCIINSVLKFDFVLRNLNFKAVHGEYDSPRT
jgi:hypothetical protein